MQSAFYVNALYVRTHLKSAHLSKYNEEIRSKSDKQLQLIRSEGVLRVANVPFSKQEQITESLLINLSGKSDLSLNLACSECSESVYGF